MHSVEGDQLVRHSRVLFTAVTSLFLSILGNILAMSKDTRIALPGIPLAFTVSYMSIRWYESFVFVGMFLLNFGKWSTENWKPRFSNYKSQLKNKVKSCSIVKHFIDSCADTVNPSKYLLIDCITNTKNMSQEDIDDLLLE